MLDQLPSSLLKSFTERLADFHRHTSLLIVTSCEAACICNHWPADQGCAPQWRIMLTVAFCLLAMGCSEATLLCDTTTKQM